MGYKLLVSVATVVFFLGCSNNAPTTVEDSSISGAAASSVGAALGSSSSSGTLSQNSPAILDWLIEKANASNACPTVLTADGSGCSNSGSNARLTYSACSFGTSSATWAGILQVALGSGSVTCGTFPTLTNTSITRQFINSSGTASTGTRTSPVGTMVTIDHSTSNLGNYQGDTIGTIVNTGYGSSVTFSSGVRTSITLAQRLFANVFDHSVTGTLNISESGTTRTISSGSITTYHNKIKMKGTTTFTSVVYNDSCCQPVSGTISTVFAKTSASPTNAVTTAVNGASETLTITGCGTGTLVDYSGNSFAVSLSTCY